MRPTGAQREKYEAELLRELDVIDELTAGLKAETKERKEEIAEHVGAAKRLRDLLQGKRHEQAEIPGTEIPSLRPRNGGIDSITLSAGGKSVTATPEQLDRALDEVKKRRGGVNPDALVGTREQAVARHQAKLDWKKEGENQVARVAGGCYCVEPQPHNGKWNALWTPDAGRSKVLALNAGDPTDAKSKCERHELERRADGMLRNAGAGELTKADTKGAAVARKKGGRRA